MNRRGFLGALAGAMTLDPERLLWRPGAKLISIPRQRASLIITDTLRAQLAIAIKQEQIAQDYVIFQHHRMLERVATYYIGEKDFRIPLST